MNKEQLLDKLTKLAKDNDDIGKFGDGYEKAINEAIQLVKNCSIPDVSNSAIDIIKWMADCPYIIDQATVPKNGIDVAPKQVVGNMSLSYIKYKQLRDVAEHYR